MVIFDTYQKAATCSDNFLSLSDNEKLVFILLKSAMTKASAKTCHEIFSRRGSLLYTRQLQGQGLTLIRISIH